MSYELKDVYSISGEKLDIVRASLTIETLVTFDKTKAIANAYIWDDNCFLKGSAKKDVKTLVRTSLSYLLKNFLDSYKEINNEESPNFIYANY